MLARRHQARAPIPARVAEHRHQQLRLQRPQQLRQPQQLRLQQPHRYGYRYSDGYSSAQADAYAKASWDSATAAIVFRNSFVGEADSFPYSWFLMYVQDLP